jgi:hypothetical protein
MQEQAKVYDIPAIVPWKEKFKKHWWKWALVLLGLGWLLFCLTF